MGRCIKSLFDKMGKIFLVLAMVITGLTFPENKAKALDDLGSTPTVTTTVRVDENNKDIIKSGDKYIISNGAEARITVSVTAQNLQGDDELKGVWSSVKLGFFNASNDVVEDNLGYGGVTARVVEDSSYWKDLEYVATVPDEEKDDAYTDSNKKFTGGELRLDFSDFKPFKTGNTYSYTVAVKFMSETQENAVFTLKTYAGYSDWQIAKEDGSTELVTDIDYKSIDTEASQTFLVNSNLKWEAKVKILTGEKMDETAPVIWQKYNYQDIILSMENTSEKSTAYFDEFEFVFRLQYNDGIDGVVNEHMTQWLYNRDDPSNPIKNTDNTGEGKGEHYTGKYLEGGLLIYDVTDLSPEDYNDIDKLGPALPYSYNTNGFGSVRITKELGGTLHSKSVVEADSTKKSKRELLVKVPFANTFQFAAGSQFVTVQNNYTPTVFFGTPQVSLSKARLMPLQYFRKPMADMSLSKTVQSDSMYVGKEAYYTISKITNKSNLPLFNPSVIDTLPSSFDLTQLEYVVSQDEVDDLDALQLSEILDVDNPIEIEVEDTTTNEKKWISLGKVFVEDSSQNSGDKRVWVISDIASVLAQYTADNATQKFTNRFKINYAFDFADYESKGVMLNSGETIVGELMVYGIPQKTMTITNNADLYAQYYYYTEHSEIHDAAWNKYEIGPFNSSVNKNVVAPQLWSVTQGLYDDGNNRTEGNPTDGTLNASVNGYTVRFGVENESSLKNGKVTMGIPHSTTLPSPYIGLKVDTIKLTADLLDKLNLKEVVITTYTDQEYKFTADQIKAMVNGDGDVIFGADSWGTDGTVINRPVKLEIYFNELDSSTTKSDPITDDTAFVEFLGDYEFPGTLTMQTKIESQYKDNEQTEINHTSTGQLNFALPKMTIRTDAITESSGVWSEGDPLTGVLYEPTSGYRVKVSTTDSSISPGYIKLQIPASFEGEKIRITEEFLNNLKNTSGKISYSKLDIIGTANEKITLEPTALDALIDSNKDLVIENTTWLNDATWKKGSRVKEVVIYFDMYQKDSTNFEDAYLEVVGKPMGVGSHVAKGTVGTNYPASSSSNISKSDDGTINILRPTMSVQTDGIVESGGVWTEGDPVTGTLNQSNSGYRVKVGSTTSSITPGYVKISLPVTFDSEKIRITEEFLSNLKAYDGKVSYTSLVITGTSNETVTLDPTTLNALIDSDKDLVINSPTWLNDAAWKKGSRVKEVTIYFDIYQKDSGNFDDAYLEVIGKPTRVENSVATGTVGTNYATTVGTNTSVSDNGTINVPRPGLQVLSYGLVVADSGRQEDDPAMGVINSNNVGYTFRIGSSSQTRIEPGYLRIDLPAGSTTNNSFKASDITLTKEMLNHMKLDKVVIKSLDNQTTELKATDLGITWNPVTGTDYMNFSQDVVISSTKWKGIASQIFVYFDYYEEKTGPVKGDDGYLEVLGTAYTQGRLTARGYIFTNYQDTGNPYNTSTYDDGILEIEPVSPTIDALAHTTQTGTNVVQNIEEQHGKNIIVPSDWNTYYTYDIGNKAKNAKILNSVVTIDLNNKLRTPSSEVHGFDSEKLVIPADYLTRFGKDGGIKKIIIVDTPNATLTPPNSIELSMDDAKVDADGNFYFDSALWEAKGIQYPKKFEFHFENFLNDITKDNDNLLRISLYGKTDWFTYIKNDNPADKHNSSVWDKLSTHAVFESKGETTKQSSESDATQDVPIPKTSLSIDYQNYYENQQGSEANGMPTLADTDSVAYVDGQRSYHVTPYEKTLVHQYSLYQDSISTADSFFSKLVLPINPSTATSEAKRGFHAQSIVVKPVLFNNSILKNFKMTIVDANDTSRKITLTATSSTSFDVVDTSGNHSALNLTSTNLELENTYWEGLGIEAVGQVYFEGTEFKSRLKDNDGDIFITGFSDSNFADESYSGGHNDITKTSADTYLRNLSLKDPSNNEYPFVARRIDEGRHLVSKMYFDLQLETGFVTAKDGSVRYKQTGVSAEHARSNYSAPGNSNGYNYNYYEDTTTIEVGYKSLVSITADFRQYLYDYQNGVPFMPNDVPNGHHSNSSADLNGNYAPDMPIAETPIDWDNKRYVKKYAYNTKADLEITVNLPEAQGFEAYYLKIDPRAVIGENGQEFISKIEFFRKDGTSFTVNGSDLVENAAKWNASPSDKTWYRINLLTLDDNQRFDTVAQYKDVDDTNPYYRQPNEKMDLDKAITHAIITVKINQSDSFDGTHAAMPDFGNWVEDTTDMADQHMFEFVGRANKTGTLSPTATAKLTIGDREIDGQGNQNAQRSTDGKDIKTTKSTWSLKNHYRQWYSRRVCGYNSCWWEWYYNLIPYTAADLYSTSTISVTERSSLDTKHGIENSMYHRKSYSNGTHDAEYTTENRKVDYLYGRERPYNITMIRRANPGSHSGYDTTAYESYIDHAYFTDTMPPLKGSFDAELGYQGFRPTKILLKQDLLKVAKTFKVTLKDGTEYVYTYDIIKNAEAVSEGGIDYYRINVYYDDDLNMKDAIKNKRDTDIVLHGDATAINYITQLDLELENINGDGDFASETHGQARNTYFEGTANQKLIRLYGNVNVVNGQEANGTYDGINRVQSFIKNDGGSQGALGTGVWSSHSPRPAMMKAFQVPLEASSTLASLEKGKLWDYEINKENGTDVGNKPDVAYYSLNFKNEGETNLTAPGDTEKYDEATISKIDFTQPLPNDFRLTKISIPKELFDGTKFKISAFEVNDGTNTVNVKAKFSLNGDNYELDLTALFKDGTLTRTNTSEKILSFRGVYEVVKNDITDLSNYLTAGKELLDGKDDLKFEGIWVDRTQDAIDKNVYDDTSTPTVGKLAYEYYSNERFPERTLKFSTAQFGTTAQIIEKNNYLDQTIYNRVSGLEISQQRGTTIQVLDADGNLVDRKTLAYDEYLEAQADGSTKMTPVDNGKLYPNDRIEHLITVSSPGTVNEDIPLKNPVLRFTAPKGTRIIGWEFVKSSDAANTTVSDEHKILDSSDLEALAYKSTDVTDQDAQVFDEGQIYDFDDEKNKTNFKDLVIKPKGDHYLSVNGSYQVIVHLEMVNEYDKKAFEGQVTTEQVYASAQYRHNYANYFIFGRSNSSSYNTRYGNDITGTANTTTLTRTTSVDANRDAANEFGIIGTSTLTYFTNNQKPSIGITYVNGEATDYADVELKIGNIANYSLHAQKNQVLDINFIKETGKGTGKQYFHLTERPSVKYVVSDSEAGKDGVYQEVIDGVTRYYRMAKIYYKIGSVELDQPSSIGGVTQGWTLLASDALTDPDAERAFLEKIEQIRIVYEDVPAFLNDDGNTLVVMDNVIFKGYAEHQEERTDVENTANQGNSTMQINVDETFIHVHEDEPLNETLVYRDNVSTKDVYRIRPRLEVELQSFSSEEEAFADYVENPSNLKMGYRPGETFWYKMVVKNIYNSSTTPGNGPLLNPIIYDKVPSEYLDFNGEEKGKYRVYLHNTIDGTSVELTDELYDKNAITSTKIQAEDIGGSQKLQYVNTAEGDAKPTDTKNNPTYNPSDPTKSTIEFTVYKFDFSKINMDLDRGCRLEIIYEVQAHEDNLPVIQWISDTNQAINGKNAYLPRFGEYSNYSYSTLYMNQNDVKDKMMDMDNLIHEFGVTGDLNHGTDPLEFLNGTVSYIPGATTNRKATGNWSYTTSDQTDKFFGDNINSSAKQKVTIGMSNDENGNYRHDKPSTDTVYAIFNNSASVNGTTFGKQLSRPRSYYTYLTSGRVANTTKSTVTADTDSDWRDVFSDDTQQNIVWAQHNLHLQKSWIASASEMVSRTGAKYYDSGTDITHKRLANHQSGGYYDANYESYIYEDNHTPALEFTEKYTSRLYASNYGDWDIKGTEFIYVFPKGARPDFNDDGTLSIQGYLYDGKIKTGTQHGNHNSTEMTDASQWKKFNSKDYESRIEYEILQNPDEIKDGNQFVLPSSSIVDARRNPNGQEERYALEEVEGCWVIKVTAHTTLRKWYNRKEGQGYIMALDIPSVIYQDTMEGYWYDRLYAAPIDTVENAYYQVYDTDYQLSKVYSGVDANEHFDLDLGGMNDYFRCTYWNGNAQPYSLFAPATMYINGFNIQNNRVSSEVDSLILADENTQIANNGNKRYYSQSGNQAVAKKPFVRYWADVNERQDTAKTSDVLDDKNFYIDVETETFDINVNLENRYYAAEYPYGVYYGNPRSDVTYSYNVEDSGARGTMFAPVYTIVLPYGMMPLNKDGRLFSETRDGTATNGINKDTNAVSWDIQLKQWDPSENSQGNNQRPHDASSLLKEQNLEKDAFRVEVEFDQTSKQYIVKFIPKNNDFDQVAKLFNEQIMQISMKTVAYDYAKNGPNATEDTDNWDAVQVYLGSAHDVFRFAADNKLATEQKTNGNPYQVLARRLASRNEVNNFYSRFTVDPRLDSLRYVEVDRTWYYGQNGQYVGDYLGKTEVRNAEDESYRFPTKQRLYDEISLLEDDFALASLFEKTAADSQDYADMNHDSHYMFTDEKDIQTLDDGAIIDAGVYNSVRLSGKHAILISEAKINDKRPDDIDANPSLTSDDIENPLDYADNIWYSLEVKNRIPNTTADGLFDQDESIDNAPYYRSDSRKTGAINHATFTYTLYLPETLRYDDTFSSAKDDKYADYYVELVNAEGNVVEKWNKDELKTHGWDVEVKSFPVDEDDPKGPQYVRAIVVPAGKEGTNASNMYLPDQRVPGHLKNGERIILHLKTRVAETGAISEDATWQEGGSEAYVNLHGLDGTKISIKDLKPVDPNAHPYSEQDIKTIEFENISPDEPIRKDDGHDFDFDGDSLAKVPSEIYSYDTVGGFKITQPDMTVRANTVRVRRILAPEPITGEIPSRDSVFRLSETQEMVLNQSILNEGAVNRFVTQFNLPYRSKLLPSSQIAAAPDPRIKLEVDRITTGKWEVPDDAKYKEELEKNLRVYVYVNSKNTQENYQNITQDIIDDVNSSWTLLNPGGSAINTNQELNIPDALNVSQVIWVVQHKDDPEHYAVPKGFRLDVDADDTTPEKEEINDVDPVLPYTKEGLHEFPFSQNILDNSIRISVFTEFVDNKGDAQYLNFFTSAWAKHSDSKNGSLAPNSYRCGYQVSSELPVMDFYAGTKYLKRTAGKYTWSDSLIFDLSISRIVKHKLELFNVNQELLDENAIPEKEDILSNPTLTVALPYRESILATNFRYVPYDKDSGVDGTPLDPNYETKNSNDLTKIQSNLQWTAYIQDTDGNKYPLKDPDTTTSRQDDDKVLLSLKGDPYFTRKKVDSGNERNTITFSFSGKLQPGQRVVVEFLASISDGLSTTNPEDMQAKGYAMKEGNFIAGRLPTLEDNGEGGFNEVPSMVGVKADRYDVNNNNDVNELVLELNSGAVSFAANTVVQRRKRASTDLNSTNVESTKPIPVQEGGIYTFTSGIQSLNTAGQPDYMAPVLFDILPYKGDEVITGSFDAADGNYKAKKRNSQWNGWLIPSSIELYAYSLVQPTDTEMKYYKIEPSEYDVYVGPLEKNADGSYQLKYDENGLPIIPDVNSRSISRFYENINTDTADSVLNTDFVKLSDILKAPNSEELIKGVRTILIKMKDPGKYVVYGGGRYELKYSMQTPLNLPIFKGDILVDTVPSEYQAYTGWNTMASAVINYNGAPNPPLAGEGINYLIGDSNESGIFTDAPSQRGYIGDYVWYDANANGKQDEAKYERIINGSRNILSELTTDFDGDGVNDDPGINGVQLELLTENGYPCNVDGEAVIANTENDKGGYFVIDEATGQYKVDIDGIRIWTSKGPATTVTQSDYYGNDGYYIFANLAPGQYKIRMTLPQEYNNYALTTPIVKEKKVTIYNPGDKLPKLNTAFDIDCNEAEVTNLTFETGTITVEAVDLTNEEAFKKYDSEAVTLDIGIGHPSRYGGTVWNDANDLVDVTNHYNGILDTGEPAVSGVQIKAYEKGESDVAIGMDGRPLVVTTNSSGDYIFESLWPNKEYQFKIENTTVKGINYKASPKTPNLNDPLAQDNDNDGVNEEIDEKKIVTVASFKTAYPIQDGQLLLDEKDPTKVKLISTIDIGLVEPGTGSIGDYVWVDKNGNGIQDENEQAYTEELELTLEPYYYNNDEKKWIAFEEDVFKNEFKNAAMTTSSNETGFYSFTKLPGIYTIGYDENDEVTENEDQVVRFENYVIGYKIKVDALPDDYTYTSYKNGKDDVDNNLRSDGYLTSPDEYIIVASEDDITKPHSKSVKVEFVVDGKTITKYYQVDSNEFFTNYDIGLVKSEKGFVSGRVWDDRNRDGLQGTEEDGYNENAIQGVKVYLERLVIGDNTYKDSIGLHDKEIWKAKSVIRVNDQGILLTNDIAPYQNLAPIKEPTIDEDGRYEVVAETITDKNGEYRFENIENYALAQPYSNDSSDPKNLPIRYRIRIEKPLNTDLTIKDCKDNDYDKIDSDFGLYDVTESPRYAISESFVLGQRLYDDENQVDSFGNKYDFTKNTKRTHVDAGLIVYPQYVELGNYVWKDTNEDGLQNDDEKGIPNVEVVLYKFNPDVESKVYELDENNQAIGTKIVKGKWEVCLDGNGKVMKVKTDANGKYAFKVLAYNLDPNSEHYLQLNHYRVKITLNEDIKWSPFKVGNDKTLDSNGYWGGNILDILVKDNQELPDIDEELPDIDEELPDIDGETPNIDGETPDIDGETPNVDEGDPSTDEGQDADMDTPIDDQTPDVDGETVDVDESLDDNPSDETSEDTSLTDEEDLEGLESEALNSEDELNSIQLFTENDEIDDDETDGNSEEDDDKPNIIIPEFDANGISPFKTPIGNIFGMSLDGYSVISDEFEIAKVYMEPEDKDVIDAIMSILVRIAKGETSQSSTLAECVTVEGSMEYFDDGDTDDTGDIGDSGDTGTPDNPTDTIDNTDDVLDNEDEEIVVKEREYVDFRSVHSDDTIDIGIVNKEIEPEPEEPDAPDNPNPIVPEEPEKPEPPKKPDEPVKENTPSVSTSDEANVGTYMWSTAISGLAMVYLVILERKRRRG